MEPEPTARRLFTVVQANRALPLVRRIVDDLKAAWKELLEARALLLSAEGAKAAVLHARLSDLEGRVERFAQELHDVGCEVKEPGIGLVDFHARVGKRLVCLCWRAGEDRVAWWHELEDGYRGRRPVHELPAETLGT